MSREPSLSIYARFSGKKRRTSLCMQAMIITAKHGTTIFFFSRYNLFLGKRKEKVARKAHVNSELVHRILLMPPAPGHPIILLKSN